MVDRDFTFGAITVRLGNCATWCGTMVEPLTSAGVQILSYTFTPAGGTAWSEVNPEPRTPDISGSGLVPVGTWLLALDSLVVFYKRPGDTSYSRNNDALAIVVVPYAVNPAAEADMVRPSAIGNPNTNATIAAHRAEELWFNTDALPSIIDLDVLTPVAGWPGFANARPTITQILDRWDGFGGELWAGGYDMAGQLPSLQSAGYGETFSGRTSDGLLMALSKEGTASQRKELARRIAQRGVDLYGAFVEGRNDGVDGGHYQGRKALVVWAGHCLEKSWVDCTPLFPGQIHEDEQFYTQLPKAWSFPDRDWPYGYLGRTEFPTDIDAPISAWGAHYPTMFYLCGYFPKCCGTNVGQALAMRLIGRTAEMGVAHDGMIAQWMVGPGAANLALIDAIVVTAVNPFTGEVYYGHPREIPWGASSSADGHNNFARAAWLVYSTYQAPTGGPEIEVAGLNNSILDGDSTPTVVDGTDFGSIQQGQATVTRSFTVTNIGDADLVISSVTVPTGFTNTGPSSGTLPPGGAAVLTVRLDSAVVGTKAGSVVIASNDANEASYDFAVTGTVNAPPTFPNIQVTGNGGNFSSVIADGDSTPSTADGTDFGNVTLSGAQGFRTFTVANAGDAPLLISSVTVPAGFTVTTALPGTIGVGQTAPLVVRLDVLSLGLKTGQVVINSNDPDTAVYNFTIAGTVVAPPSVPDMTMPGIANGAGAPVEGDARNFGSVVNGAAVSVSRSFTVQNVGTGNLSVSGATVPTGFTVTTPLPSSIPAGGSAALVVRLTPATVGVKSGNVVITTDDPSERTYVFAITGEVLAEGGGNAPANPRFLGRVDLPTTPPPGRPLRPRRR